MHFMHYQYLSSFLAGFCISSHLKLIIPELHQTANHPVLVILFSAFNPDFSILLNLHVYSIFNLSFVGWFSISSLSTALGTWMFVLLLFLLLLSSLLSTEWWLLSSSSSSPPISLLLIKFLSWIQLTMLFEAPIWKFGWVVISVKG